MKTITRTFLPIAIFSWILFGCAHETIRDLKETENQALGEFDICVKKNTLELLSTDGTPGEIADFVLNSCDPQFKIYQEATRKYFEKKGSSPEAENAGSDEKIDKFTQAMWDKIRAKVIRLVEKRRKKN